MPVNTYRLDDGRTVTVDEDVVPFVYTLDGKQLSDEERDELIRDVRHGKVNLAG